MADSRDDYISVGAADRPHEGRGRTSTLESEAEADVGQEVAGTTSRRLGVAAVAFACLAAGLAATSSQRAANPGPAARDPEAAPETLYDVAAAPPPPVLPGAVPPPLTPSAGAPKRELLKAISYSPVPLREVAYLPHEDFMSADTKSLWSETGCRQDLKLMKAMGANAVRLYGDDADQDHKQFLDEALQEGLKVIPGLGDHAYTDMEGSCRTTNFNCFTQVLKQYSSNLQRGYFSENGKYHPALEMVVLINEPELKFEMQHGTAGFCKAVISAMDAVLEAEAVAGVIGRLPKLAIVASFTACSTCSSLQGNPGLGQLDELRRAFRNPEMVGYTPKHDVWDAYQHRVVNGINTANTMSEFLQLFMKPYTTSSLAGVPLFVGEFHSPGVDLKAETSTMLQVAETSGSVIGVSFLEFQVRYDKGPKEMKFGMFGFGEEMQGEVPMGGKTLTAWCLTPQADAAGQLVPQSITEAFGGVGVEWSELCNRNCDAIKKVAKTYDCLMDADNWAMMWSPLKQRYCCEKTGTGCQAATTQPPATTADSTTQSSLPFPCRDGQQDVPGHWSPMQREWCCLQLHLGCPQTTPSTTPQVTTPAAPADPHDCEQDYGSWATDWPETKIDWCCLHQQRGCSDKTAMLEATSMAFDCDDGYQKWAEIWPAGKQAWCCLNEAKGCHSEVTPQGFVKIAADHRGQPVG